MNSSDVTVAIASALGSRMIEAISFPIVQRVTPSFTTESPHDNEVDFEISQTNTPLGTHDTELSKAIETGLLDAARGLRDGSVDSSKEDPATVEALRVLARKLFDGVSSEGGQVALDPEISAALNTLLKKPAISFKVGWVDLRMERPKLTLGNPITLTNMLLHARANVVGCIRLFGKDYCKDVTSPWIKVRGDRANLSLRGDGTKVFATASFSDIDIIITITILGFSFDIPIGITKIVNKAMGNKPIEIMDLSMFEQKVPYSDKKLRIREIDFPNVAGSLNLSTSFDIM